MRCFISINIHEDVIEEIEKIQQKLPVFQGKKTELGNLHLTLKFLGEINEDKIEEVKEKLREIKVGKFESEIDSIGVFSEKFIKIIWLHLKGRSELQKTIDEKLKDLFEPEKRFMSHLTIARVKAIKDAKEFLNELKKIKFSKIKFQVDKFYLMKSELVNERPRYGVLEEYSLV